jgi:hypothetical protein
MKYNPIKNEIRWWNDKKPGRKIAYHASIGHNFVHSCIRSKLYDTLVALGQ